MTISAAKPTGNAAAGPRWADISPGTVRVEPTSGQKNTGWTNGQRPPFGVMNWLQGVTYDWQQYLEDATDQLESSKLNRDGSGTNGIITGDILPDNDSARSLGSLAKRFNGQFQDIETQFETIDSLLTFQSAARVGSHIKPNTNAAHDLGESGLRWDDVFFDATDTNTLLINTTLTMGASARLASDFLPSANNTRDLGSSSLRWSDVFSTNIDVNTIVVNTSVLPDASGGADCGSLTKPWDDLIAHNLVVDNLNIYRSAQPTTVAELQMLNQRTLVVAAGVQTSTTASPAVTTQANSKYNINDFTHGSTGQYEADLIVNLQGQPLCVIATPSQSNRYLETFSDGASIEVRTFDATTNAAAGCSFSMMAIGFPSAGAIGSPITP